MNAAQPGKIAAAGRTSEQEAEYLSKRAEKKRGVIVGREAQRAINNLAFCFFSVNSINVFWSNSGEELN